MRDYQDLPPFAKVLLFPINVVVIGTILMFLGKAAVWVFQFAWGL